MTSTEISPSASKRLSSVYNNAADISSVTSRSLTRSRSPSHSSMRIKDLSQPAQDGRKGALFVDIGRVSSLAEVALSALQYLPTPVLVLSSLKTVVLGNEAMGRLLGLDVAGALDSVETGDGSHPLSVTDVLRGQTLSQIGIDMLQDGRPVWVSWERFLDNLAEEMDRNGPALVDSLEEPRNPLFQGGASSPRKAPEDAGEEDPDAETARLELHRHKSMVHDAVIDVVLSSQYIHSGVSGTTKSSSSDTQVQAKMIVSIWTLENQRYYTLTFTNAAPDSLPNTPPQSRTVTRTPNSVSLSPPTSASTGHSRCSLCSPSPPLTSTPPTPAALSTSPFPPMGAPARSNLSSTPSILQKVTRMKDAILETMELPVFAMWKDGSLAIPNQAGRRLLQQGIDPLTKDGYDLISRFRMWSEDFERELGPEEFPIVEICRTQQPFASRIVGMKDPVSGRNITYDVSGKGIMDEATGEFLAGLIWMRDVTVYKDRIATQREENEQRFKTICDCMPQLMWTTRPDGYHDYFSQRWYDYTGLTEEESLGMGWQLPFHADDIKISREKWAHSLATGEDYLTEYRCRRHDGVWRWMLGRALPMRDRKTGEILKWYGTCTDIHDVVEARIAARRTREQLLNVIAHAQVTLWAVDRRRNLTLLEGRMIWNVGDSEGCSCSEAYLGRNIYEVLGHSDSLDPPEFLKPIEDIMKGKRAEDLEEHTIDGRWYRTRYVPILGKKIGEQIDESKIDGVIGVSVDVTELKDRERELQSQGNENTRLLANEAAAKEASRLKSQFLANVGYPWYIPCGNISILM
jgi:PAS domain S-box-containing protein